MKHDVTVFAVIKCRCTGIEARDHKAATEKAWGFLPELHRVFATGNLRFMPEGISAVEFGNEISGFIVDEQNDSGHERSTWHHGDGRQISSCKAA